MLGRGGSVIDFNPALHPRDRVGRFRDVLNALKPGQSVRLPDGTTVEKRKHTFHVNDPRVKGGYQTLTVGGTARAALRDDVDKAGWHPDVGQRIIKPAEHFGAPFFDNTAERRGVVTGLRGYEPGTGERIVQVRYDNGETETQAAVFFKPAVAKWDKYVGVPESPLPAKLHEAEVESRSLPPIPNKPGKSNWVEKAGGLPSYIERVARHLQAKGRPTGVAIATAVNHAKKMCASGTAFGGKTKVSGKAQAVACKAVAEWEAKKAKSKVSEAELLQEWGGALGRSVAFDPSFHPRDRLGQFIKTINALKPGEHAKLQGYLGGGGTKDTGVTVKKLRNGKFKVGDYRFVPGAEVEDSGLGWSVRPQTFGSAADAARAAFQREVIPVAGDIEREAGEDDLVIRSGKALYEAADLTGVEERAIIEIAEASFWEMKLDETRGTLREVEGRASGTLLTSLRARADYYAKRMSR